VYGRQKPELGLRNAQSNELYMEPGAPKRTWHALTPQPTPNTMPPARISLFDVELSNPETGSRRVDRRYRKRYFTILSVLLDIFSVDYVGTYKEKSAEAKDSGDKRWLHLFSS